MTGFKSGHFQQTQDEISSRVSANRTSGKISLLRAAGKSYQQIADELGLSVGTVKSRLSRERDRLFPEVERKKRPYAKRKALSEVR